MNIVLFLSALHLDEQPKEEGYFRKYVYVSLCRAKPETLLLAFLSFPGPDFCGRVVLAGNRDFAGILKFLLFLVAGGRLFTAVVVVPLLLFLSAVSMEEDCHHCYGPVVGTATDGGGGGGGGAGRREGVFRSATDEEEVWLQWEDQILMLQPEEDDGEDDEEEGRGAMLTDLPLLMIGEAEV